MRIRRAIATAFIALVPIFPFTTTPAHAATPSAACFKLPYFGPWGHADFDFGPDIIKQLGASGLKIEGIDPVRAKRGNSGIYMPIGWKQDHIDPCRGVYYPGGFRLVHEDSGKVASLENFWLRLDGVYFNVSVDGEPLGEVQVGTYRLVEFMPGILTPRPLEGGIGPYVWPFYVAPGLTKLVEELGGVKVPAGQYMGNLNAVVKFLP